MNYNYSVFNGPYVLDHLQQCPATCVPVKIRPCCPLKSSEYFQASNDTDAVLTNDTGTIIMCPGPCNPMYFYFIRCQRARWTLDPTDNTLQIELFTGSLLGPSETELLQITIYKALKIQTIRAEACWISNSSDK
jgi:hypothetical protein